MADERTVGSRESRALGKQKKSVATEQAAGVRTQQRKPRRAPRPEECRQFVLERLAEALPALVGTLVERSQEGSLGHMRLVFQLSGLDKAGTTTTGQPARDLAAELIEEWTIGESDAGSGAGADDEAGASGETDER